MSTCRLHSLRLPHERFQQCNPAGFRSIRGIENPSQELARPLPGRHLPAGQPADRPTESETLRLRQSTQTTSFKGSGLQVFRQKSTMTSRGRKRFFVRQPLCCHMQNIGIVHELLFSQDRLVFLESKGEVSAFGCGLKTGRLQLIRCVISARRRALIA